MALASGLFLARLENALGLRLLFKLQLQPPKLVDTELAGLNRLEQDLVRLLL